MSRNEEAKKDAEQQVSEELANQPKQNSGRDDNSVAGSTTVPSHLFRSLQSCHPDRSVAEWRDLQCALRLSQILPRMRPRMNHPLGIRPSPPT
jgi:hypothetical protein